MAQSKSDGARMPRKTEPSTCPERTAELEESAGEWPAVAAQGAHRWNTS